MFEQVDARRQRLDAYRPFSAEQRARLDAVFEPWFIYGSNAIEGNTLTLADTILLIRDAVLPAGKTETEYLEVKGQQAAYAYLHAAAAASVPPSERLVREFHQLLTGNLDPEKYRPGQYKDRDNQVRLADGSLFPYVSHVATPAAMQDLVTWWLGDGRKLHPIEQAAWLHYKLILIHPFRDGNGRTARLLTNLLLLQSGYNLTIFRAAERRRVYLDALRAVDSSVPAGELVPDHPHLNLFPFVSYLEQELLWSYDQALDVLEGRTVVTTEDLIRRFSALEQRSLAAAGIAPDERTRRERASETTREVTRNIAAQVQELSDKLNTGWPNLLSAVRQNSGLDLLDRFAFFSRTPREQLGITSAVLGTVGEVVLSVHRREDSPLPIEVPYNACQFEIFMEPHALTVAAIHGVSGADGSTETTQIDTAHVRLTPGSEPSREARIKTFVLEQVNRFLERTEAEVTLRNQAHLTPR
jgi:hypothetical protein